MKNFEKKIKFYLPERVSFRFRDSVLKEDNIFHNKTTFKKRHQLDRIHRESKAPI